MKITETLQAFVKVTVKKTGKTYYRSMNYAKHITTKQGHKYFLRHGNKWIDVTAQGFKLATTKQAIMNVQDQLEKELRKRVEQIMRDEENERKD